MLSAGQEVRLAGQLAPISAAADPPLNVQVLAGASAGVFRRACAGLSLLSPKLDDKSATAIEPFVQCEPPYPSMARSSSDQVNAPDRLLDGYLVVSAQAGDRAAAEALAGRYHRRLLAHAWRLTGDLELAKDVVQSSWVDIARGLPRLNDKAAFPAWAYQIVSRRCARSIRGRQADRALASALSQAGHEEPTPPPEIATPRLKAAILALPASQRAALALFYFEDLSVSEIAVALDVAVGTVKTRLMHARRALRAVLEGEDNV